MAELQNDRGGTETEPFKYYAGTGDVKSWARLFKSYWRQVNNLAVTSDDPLQREQAQLWLEQTQKYAELADESFGFGVVADFGFSSNEDLIAGLIDVTKEARDWVDLLGGEQGVELPTPGGQGEVSSTNKELRIFVAGAALAALAWVGYRASQGRVSIG